MNFEKLFRVLSYTAVFCGFVALWISGTFGWLGTGLFAGAGVLAWQLEGTRWQIGEKLGTALILGAMPVYYLFWKYGLFAFASTESALPGMLARLILTLSAIKLLQAKSDRDWVFLYVMAFFQVLLAAGLSISALYLGVFITYVLVMACTIILFEIKRTEAAIAADPSLCPSGTDSERLTAVPKRRLPATALLLIVAIIAVAAPMFFLLPRIGGAGIGGAQGGVSTSSGFSDTVRLGGIGRIQQNDEVVMRIRIENPDGIQADLRWRGLALDTFDNLTWRKSRAAFREVREQGERDVIQVDHLASREGLIVQQFYLEPLDSPVLFVLPRAVGIQGSFPIVFRDTHGSLSFPAKGERVSYRVISDVLLPPPDDLRSDMGGYGRDFRNYLQLPGDLDPRISELAAAVTAGANNKFDAALRTEQFLQNEFGYTLEQKSGGDQPLADFLFNIREGHCEYFATAMAIMLRTQGIATRVVNGFQRGEYNETADVWVVRQSNAHSWVEVYFPELGVWVPFDPTPFAGQNTGGEMAGISAAIGRYLDALETYWIQYFVAFDDQEQRSLFTNIRRGITEYNAQASGWLAEFQDALAAWWSEARGDSGSQASAVAIGYGAAFLAGVVIVIMLFVWAWRRIVKLEVWARLRGRFRTRRRASIIEFYDRMLKVLAEQGIVRAPYQTPLEFAHGLGIPEAVSITDRYNRVRFGEAELTDLEANEIESWLVEISATNRETDTIQS